MENGTMLFQLLNVLIWIAIIYFVVKLIVRLPKKFKNHEDRLERIKNTLEEINKKLN